MKRQARRIPKLAASAVASIVFGPGVKLIAVAKDSRVGEFLGGHGAQSTSTRPAQHRYTLSHVLGVLYRSRRQHIAERWTQPPTCRGSPSSRAADATLTEQLAARFAERIRQRLLAPGARLPSVRECARRHGVSPYTVVAAYDQLLALGLVDARRQRGFFVRELAATRRAGRTSARRDAAGPRPLPVERHHADPRHVPAARRASRCPASARCPPTGSTCRCWPARCARRRPARARRRSLQYGDPAGERACARALALKLADLGVAARARADRHHGRRDPRARHRDAHAAARRRQRAGRRARLVGRVRAPGRARPARAAGAARRGRARPRRDGAADRRAEAARAPARLRHGVGAAQPDRRVALAAGRAPAC